MTELQTPAAEHQSTTKRARAAWWTLGVLTFVSILDWADRALISVVAEPLRHEFGLSDTELGFSMAFAFGLVRIFIGIPVGRLADTHNRRNLLASALALWSVMTIAFGMARNYTQLFWARVVIGAGTTGAYPPAVSMISDLFPLRKRGFAMGIFNTGSVIGFSLGMAVGAMIVELYGWRAAMIAFGLFGVVLAVLLLLILKEPPRRDSKGEEITTVEPPPLRQVLRFMLGQRSLFHLIVAFSLVNIMDAVSGFWTISFYVRSHGMTIGEAGTALGVVWVVAGLAGVLLGGYLLDYLGRRDIRWHSWMLVRGGVVVHTTLAAGFPRPIGDAGADRFLPQHTGVLHVVCAPADAADRAGRESNAGCCLRDAFNLFLPRLLAWPHYFGIRQRAAGTHSG